MSRVEAMRQERQRRAAVGLCREIGCKEKVTGRARCEYHAQRQVEAAKQEIKALGSQIATQNAAVDALKADGEKRVKAAADGLAAAHAAAGAAQRQAGTLREALKTATNLRGPAAGCPPSGADRAVAAIRANLK